MTWGLPNCLIPLRDALNAMGLLDVLVAVCRLVDPAPAVKVGQSTSLYSKRVSLAEDAN